MATSATSLSISNDNKSSYTSASDYAPADSSKVVSCTWCHNEEYTLANYTSGTWGANFTIQLELYACKELETFVYRITGIPGIWIDGISEYYGYRNTSANYQYIFGITIGDANTTIISYFYGGTTADATGLDTGWLAWPSDQINKLYFVGWCSDTDCYDDPSGSATATNTALDKLDGSATASNDHEYSKYNIININGSSVTWYTAPTYSDGNYGIKNVTGQTISARMFTYSEGSDSFTARTIKCVGSNYSSEVTVNSDACTTFSGLTNGTDYTLTFYATDGTTPKTLTASATTYACSLSCSSDNITSRCARVTYTNTKYWSTGGSKSGSVTLNNSAKTISTGSTGTWTNLTHKTTYSISAYVTGLYTFSNSDKDVTTTTAKDATADINITTKELTLSGVVGSVGQHTMSTTWTSKVGGVNTYQDALNSNYFTMSYTLKSNNATGSGYIADSSTYTGSATLSSATQVFTRSDLTYYCSYTMTVTLSDGVNSVTATVTFITTYPYARIYYNGAWRKAFVYIYSGGWKLAVGHVYSSGWKEFNGE